MTQATQPQPVQTPEQQPNFLRRGLDAASSMPFVLGARVGAENTAERLDNAMPTRAEAIAIGAVVLVALGVGANVANAQKADTQKPNTPQAPGLLEANASQSSAEISAVEGSRQVVKTSLSNVPEVRTSFIWKRNKKGKKVPTRKVRVKISDMPGHPGDWDIPPADFLDKPVSIAVAYTKRREGSNKPRIRVSNVRRVTIPSHFTRVDFFNRQVVLKLRQRPNPKKDDWAIKTKKTVDPIVGGPQSKSYIDEKFRPETTGPIT